MADAAWSYYDALRAAGAPPNTLRQYRSRLISWMSAHGARLVRSITAPDLFGYLYGPNGVAHGSESAASSHRAVIQGALDHAHYMGWCSAMRVPKPAILKRRQPREWTRYTAPQMCDLIEAASDPRLKIGLSLACNTALRISDILVLKVPELKMESGYMRSHVQKSRMIDDKPITSDLEDELRLYLKWYTQECGAVLKSDYFLIPGFRQVGRTREGPVHETVPSRPVSYTWITDKFRDAVDLAGLPREEGESWHSLRRSAARVFFDRASDAGYDTALRMTQDFLNHKRADTTERYLGLTTERVKRDELLRGRSLLRPDELSNVLPLRRSGQ